MSNPRKPLSTLIKAVHAEALARVSLKGVDRNLLLQPLEDEFASSGNRQTTLAHQFGRMRQLHRIQPLLLIEDYDFSIEIRRQFHEPPLFCFVDTSESVDLVPQEIFTEARLFAQYEADGPFMWMQRLVMSDLIHRIPKNCLTKQRLLTPYFPDHLETTVLATLIGFGQTEGIYPTVVSASDIIESESFSDLIVSICRSEFAMNLNPNDFASCYPVLKPIWEKHRQRATPAASKWFIAVTKAYLGPNRLSSKK